MSPGRGGGHGDGAEPRDLGRALPTARSRRQRSRTPLLRTLGSAPARAPPWPRALTVIQVQLVQVLRLSLDRYGSGGQTMITVLTHLGQRQRPGGCRRFFRNLRQLVLQMAHPGWAGWAAGLQTGRLLGTGQQRRGGAVGTECWLVTRGTAAAQLWTHLWLLGGAWVHAHGSRRLLPHEGPPGWPLKSEGVVARAGHALAVGGRREVVELRAGAGRRWHHAAPRWAGREAGREAGSRVGRHGELLAVARLRERAQALARWSTGQGRLVVVGGLRLDDGNCEEERKLDKHRLRAGARGGQRPAQPPKTNGALTEPLCLLPGSPTQLHTGA